MIAKYPAPGIVPHGWIAFADRAPPMSKRLDDPTVSTFDRVLVTNNPGARDAMGRMSHVWFVTPQTLEPQSEREGQGEWIGYQDTSGRAIEWLSHWFDPFAVVEVAGEEAQAQSNGLANFEEGWGLFDYDGLGLWEIQRDNDSGKFQRDDEALAFVREKAAEGSERHVKALAEHDRDAAAIEERRNADDDEEAKTQVTAGMLRAGLRSGGPSLSRYDADTLLEALDGMADADTISAADLKRIVAKGDLDLSEVSALAGLRFEQIA